MDISEVNRLVKQFDQMRKMMKHNGMLGRLMSGAPLPETPAPGTFGGLLGGPAPISKKEQDRKKRLAKLARKERQKQRKRRK